MTDLDISRTFVEIATENARQSGVSIDFQLGDAASMPFAEGSFDLVVWLPTEVGEGRARHTASDLPGQAGGLYTCAPARRWPPATGASQSMR